ncbi:adenylate kinase 7-like [Mizuhopecten yessoensis]|uniref:Adenylate kinase 7 n=1 Tax=Mizuhopecten yessoensis TaxID=6573 RepID=A0A210Q4I7_MIZYE|nr:adenylate kinase 7-like [Mizuhopecten yessoensis]OWF43656.1 Adenylate kinase 7 [Mizuhopecten yessoensis]
MADEMEKPKSKRVFVNHVDQYQGKNIGKYLSRCVVGSSLEEPEEEDDAMSTTSSIPLINKEGCYEVVGTLKDREAPKPDYVKEIIQFENKDQLYEHLVECDVILYDITEDPDQIDEAVWAVSEIHSDLDKIEKPKMFILISTVMTWAKSKPLDPDDPEIPFTEDDYRRRKPHPNNKEHISAEKTVIKMGKTNKAKLVTYVVASGLTYGAEENIFHYLFKSAWHNAPQLLCFGNGQNVIPTIHIKDLAGVIQNIADSRPKVRYLIAKDDAQNTLEEIVKAVSQNLGTGKVKMITKEEALLSKDIEQSDFDQLLVNLRMDAVNVKENMRVNWAAETGLVENIQQIIKEYKDSRRLQPLRVCVVGPPASGKSTVVQQLCEFYKLHHIKIKDVIDEAMDNLTTTARRADSEDQEEEDGKAQDAQDLIDRINEGKDQTTGRLEDQHVIQFFKDKLLSMSCQNQGFIIDGFPKTIEQAKELFASEDDEEPEEAAKAGSYNKLLMPEFVFNLESNDDFLHNRVMNLPESVVNGTHNTEEGLIRRLDQYRSINNEDETVLNYFDEIEFHPEKVDVTKDDSHMMKDTVEKLKKVIGAPRNYGPTAEELEEMKRVEEEAHLKHETEERQERERREAEESALRKQRQEEWTQRLNEVKREEYELLEAQSIPLRNYLMKHVMPTLTQGLIDCCKTRPDDPIDALAEYLFQNNPQVD